MLPSSSSELLMELFMYDRRVSYRQSGEVIKGWNSRVLD